MLNLKEQITAAEFRRMVISASAAIDNNKQKLNELNVFPVPDGDTGTNMSLTARAAASALSENDSDMICEAAQVAASALLRGARGNSGVILSLLFRGFAKSCAEKKTIDSSSLADALAAGVETAYRAVMKPAEGTILSVSRCAAEKAKEICGEVGDVTELFEKIIEAGNVALEETTEQNPVLKKANVVDAGAFGWMLVLGAMRDSLLGNDTVPLDASSTGASTAVFADADEEITFGYCTEFIVNISREGKKLDVAQLRAYLESIGDCVVVVDDDDIIKVHVHTNNPDRAIGKALGYGELVNIKIDNMRYQHTQKVVEQENEKPKVAKAETKYGFAVVGAGAGVINAFRDLGANTIIEGGQTMNPSTDDILAAINATPSEVVFVLPNNKNIIMAAQQTEELTEKQVVVLETKTIPQGISAMLAFDPDSDTETNLAAMNDAAKNVGTGLITYAARDSEFDGYSIKEGEYLALNEGKLSSSGADLRAVAEKLASDMNVADKSFITVFYGDGVKEESAAEVESVYKSAAPDAETILLDGGQPVYYYMISAE